jgi:hypothetical protein
MKKDTWKRCEFHKFPYNNIDECLLKQPLVAELNSLESEEGSNSESNPYKGNQIIDTKPSATIATTKVQPSEPEEGEFLFHSYMWVKGVPLHFIVDRGSQKNLISAEVLKRLKQPTTPYPHTYTIGWLHQGRYLHVIQHFHLLYNIKPFKDEVFCDIPPLEVCDVTLGQPYLWKQHVLYESRPHSFIITLGRQFHRIPKVYPPTSIYFFYAKKCRKVISQTKKFFFFVIFSQSE